MSNRSVKISIGVITHTPYMGNYANLINELVEQTKNELEIEIIALIQLAKDYKCRTLFGKKSPNLKEYVLCETLSPASARNYILDHTNGDWIAYIDGDCVVGKKYVSALKNAINGVQPEIQGIQGAIYASSLSRFGKYEFFYDIISLLEMETVEAKTFFKSTRRNANKSVEKCYKNLERNYVRKFQGFNFVVSRELVEKIGKFNTEIETAEDREYSARVDDIGGKIIFEKELSVFHGYDMSLGRILKRKKWHALGCAYLREKHGQVYDLDIKERLLYSLDIFCSCKKLDYLVYQIASDIVFWGKVKKEMNRRFGYQKVK